MAVSRVIAISIARLSLVIQGQWLLDGSWYYNPMLVVETAEIGATLVALSVPGLKPLLGRWFEIWNHSAVPASTTTNGIQTYGSMHTRRMKGGTKLESETENRTRHTRPGDSDDSLVESMESQVEIEVRTSLRVESRPVVGGDDIQMENYPKPWEQKQ